MTLHRIDHTVRDQKGRKLRRVSRYVERQPSGASATVVLPPPPGAVDRATGHPPPPEPLGETVELEDTAVVRELRRQVAELKGSLADLAAGAALAGKASAAGDLPRAVVEAIGRLESRVAAIEAALAALGAAAEVAAQRDS